MKINFRTPIEEKSDEELIAICNLDRHNGDIRLYTQRAYEELIRRGKTPIIAERDEENAAIYVLPQKE